MKGTEFELKAWDSCQMEELYSKIHDERQCVTCKSICLDLGVTRNVAVQMLEALPFFKAVDKGDDPVSYEVIWCVARKVGSKSVMKLQKSKLRIDSDMGSNDYPKFKIGTIYSIALIDPIQGTPSINSAHAYTMALLRDALQDTEDTNINLASPLLDPEMACVCIQPSCDVQRVDTSRVRQARIAGVSPVGGSQKSAANKFSQTSSSTKPKSAVGTKKITTAASFFGAQAASKTVKKEQPSLLTKGANTETDQDSKKKRDETDKKIIETRNDRKFEQNTNKDEEFMKIPDNKENIRKTRKRSKRINSSSNPKKVEIIEKGNADDFEGDQDEDDEFVREEEERKKRNAINARKMVRDQAVQEKRLEQSRKRRPRLPAVEDDGMEDMEILDEKVEIKGAMDKFTSKNGVISSSKDGMISEERKGTKRRKQVLEEKTFMENGYLKTETVVVWKEIEESEEERQDAKASINNFDKGSTGQKPILRKKSGAPKSTKNMKQAGLMGFFSKK